jgi:hypothetical protein
LKIVAIAASAVLTFSAQAFAANQVMIVGNGTRSCAEWTSNRNDPTGVTTIAMEAWIGGFITAFNSYGAGRSGDILNGMTSDAVWTWMDHYCRANPRDQLAVAAVAFVKDLSGRRNRS